MQIVLATSNKGKVREIASILGEMSVVIKTKADFGLGEIPETGSTFEENALFKAKTVSEATGMIALADDSGLVVPYLNGEPGVYSARYAGPKATDEQNNVKLLARLQGVPKEQRSAYFVCVLALWSPTGKYFLVQGKWDGYIAERPRGENGFGYDPIFVDKRTGLTAAELSPEQKNQISHRAKALCALQEKWPYFWAELDRV